MDAEQEMQEYSERHMSRGRIIVGRVFTYAFRVLVFGIIALVLWRVLLSDRIPKEARTLLVNEATYAAYLAEGESLTMYTQAQDEIAVNETEDGVYGLFWVSQTVFIPEADQIQILTRYNNSTLRHIATDFKLAEIPAREDIVADVTLVVTTDPTPLDRENGDEVKVRYAASGAPAVDETSMYNYRKYIFDGVDFDPATTVDITVEFFYIDRVDYDDLPYCSLRIFDREFEIDPLTLTSRDERALASYAGGQ
ncbi:MAG: hypothetical protein J6R04_08775 [Clostridia bacterium]|nr:hypothetical protein [Clostridia bacterium]